jgi:drug/metabolite transporter (DMT)-like permease
MQMIFGGIFMLAFATAHGEWSRLTFNTRTAIAEVYLTVAGSIVGYTAYTYALRYLPTATVSLYAYANPVIAMVLGALLANEPFGPRVIVASLMVLTGSALVQWRGVSGRRLEAQDLSDSGLKRLKAVPEALSREP